MFNRTPFTIAQISAPDGSRTRGHQIAKLTIDIENVNIYGLQKLPSFFSTKNDSVFGYKVVKHLTSWPLNELVRVTVLLTTGPWPLRDALMKLHRWVYLTEMDKMEKTSKTTLASCVSFELFLCENHCPCNNSRIFRNMLMKVSRWDFIIVVSCW